MKRKIVSFSYSVLISIIMVSCGEDSPTQTINLVSASEREINEISLSDRNTIGVENRIGTIILNGTGREDSVRYFLYKTCRAETKTTASDNLNRIGFIYNVKNDTMYFAIAAPPNSPTTEYSCGLSLDVPFDIPCIVNEPNLGVSTSFLNNTLIVTSSSNKIDITKHVGSCDVTTSDGDINIELILPKDGYCRAFTASGSILLEIPAATSATIQAKTSNGSISFSNIDITELNESEGMLSGKLGNGAGEISLITDNGNIEIKGIN